MNLLETALTGLNWSELHRTLDKQGFAKLPRLLSADTCRKLVQEYDNEDIYRKTIDMARYRFGIGEYKYYQAPLPDVLQELREGLYPELAKAWVPFIREPDTAWALSFMTPSSARTIAREW
nr:2OG-Fe(II) oxygenase [Paenibacillus pinihumi]